MAAPTLSTIRHEIFHRPGICRRQIAGSEEGPQAPRHINKDIHDFTKKCAQHWVWYSCIIYEQPFRQVKNGNQKSLLNWAWEAETKWVARQVLNILKLLNSWYATDTVSRCAFHIPPMKILCSLYLIDRCNFSSRNSWDIHFGFEVQHD